MRRLILVALLLLGATTAHAQVTNPLLGGCDREIIITRNVLVTVELLPVLPSNRRYRVCSMTVTAGDGTTNITGTDPAAGADIIETVPANARWTLLFARATLVTDATVTNRTSNLAIDDGTTEIMRWPAPTSQTATNTWTWVWGNVGAVANQGSAGVAVLVQTPLILPTGWRFRTSSTGIVAGDNWGAPTYVVQEHAPIRLHSGTGVTCATGRVFLQSSVFFTPPGETVNYGVNTQPTFGTAVCADIYRATQVTITLRYTIERL